MPTEYYFGIAIAIIVLILLGLLLKPGQGRRRIVQHQTSATDQTAVQLSRIADSLEKLVVHLGTSPNTGKPIVEKHSNAMPSVEQQSIEKPIIERTNIEKPSVHETSVPLSNTVEPGDIDQKKIDQPTERHVKLSMFGR